MSKELKACPFCGGEQVTTAPNHHIGDAAWAAICKACGASVQHDTEAEAITAWNTRATDAENQRLRAEVDALRAELDLNHPIERRTLLQVRSFLARHGAAQVDAYCQQRLHDMAMDARAALKQWKEASDA